MKKRILLVEDDYACLQSLAHVLIAENYVPLLAKNGHNALEIVVSAPVDLVIMDINPPVDEATQTFGALSSDYPLLPIIVITAAQAQIPTFISAIAGALVEKPLDPAKLLQIIEQLLNEPPESRLAWVADKRVQFRSFTVAAR